MSRGLAPSQQPRSSPASQMLRFVRPRPAQTRRGVKERPMNVCTGISAIQLSAAAFTSWSSCSLSKYSGSGSRKSCMAATLPSRSGSGDGSTPSSQPVPLAPRSCCCSGCIAAPMAWAKALRSPPALSPKEKARQQKPGFFTRDRNFQKACPIPWPSRSARRQGSLGDRPVLEAFRHALFDGGGDRFRGQLSRVNLLGVMEAAAERQTGGDGGESNDDAHGGILLLGTVTQIGTRDFAHLTALGLEKR